MSHFIKDYVAVPRTWIRGLWSLMRSPAVCPGCDATAKMAALVVHQRKCVFAELAAIPLAPRKKRSVPTKRRRR